MNWNQIAATWGADLATKLQHRYGLPEAEAREKVDAWLAWVKSQATT
jgi:hypothetical protein